MTLLGRRVGLGRSVPVGHRTQAHYLQKLAAGLGTINIQHKALTDTEHEALSLQTCTTHTYRHFAHMGLRIWLLWKLSLSDRCGLSYQPLLLWSPKINMNINMNSS